MSYKFTPGVKTFEEMGPDPTSLQTTVYLGQRLQGQPV